VRSPDDEELCARRVPLDDAGEEHSRTVISSRPPRAETPYEWEPAANEPLPEEPAPQPMAAEGEKRTEAGGFDAPSAEASGEDTRDIDVEVDVLAPDELEVPLEVPRVPPGGRSAPPPPPRVALSSMPPATRAVPIKKSSRPPPPPLPGRKG